MAVQCTGAAWRRGWVGLIPVGVLSPRVFTPVDARPSDDEAALGPCSPRPNLVASSLLAHRAGAGLAKGSPIGDRWGADRLSGFS